MASAKLNFLTERWKLLYQIAFSENDNDINKRWGRTVIPNRGVVKRCQGFRQNFQFNVFLLMFDYIELSFLIGCLQIFS
jgi:hypothetical protein